MKTTRSSEANVSTWKLTDHLKSGIKTFAVILRQFYYGKLFLK